MPSPKVSKTHFQTETGKALCGSLVAKNLSTDSAMVDCANCTKLLPTLPTVVSIPIEESFTEKFDKSMLPENFVPSVNMSGDAGKRPNANENIGSLISLSPMHVHVLGNWNLRTQFPDESIKRLAANIAKNGLRVPLIVFLENGYYYLIDGERRLRAILWLISQGNDFKAVQCIVSKKQTETDRIITALITSSEKEPLSPHDEANAFQRLRNHQWSIEDIATATSKKPAYITRHLKMLQANPSLLRLLDENAVTVTEVFKILKLAENMSQKAAQDKVLAEAEDGRTKAAKEKKLQEDKEKADREKLNRENLRRASKGLPLLDAEGKEIPVVSPEDDAEFQKALAFSSAAMADTHASADTSPPLARGEFHLSPIEPGDVTDPDGDGFEDDETALPHGTPPNITISPAVARSVSADRKGPDPYLSTPAGRLDVIMSSLFMDAPADQPLPTMLMILRWCVTRTKNPTEVMDACTQACDEYKRTQEKVIKPLGPLASIKVQGTVQLGKEGSARVELDAMPPAVKA